MIYAYIRNQYEMFILQFEESIAGNIQVLEDVLKFKQLLLNCKGSNDLKKNKLMYNILNIAVTFYNNE